MNITKPQFSLVEAGELILGLFGMDGSLRPLASYSDQNFLLEAPTGRFVLKIAHLEESADALDLQNQAMLHLQGKLPFAIPRPIASKEGQLLCRAPFGPPHLVRLLNFLPGAFLAQRLPQPDFWPHLGAGMARLVLELSGLEHPARRRHHAWSLLNLPDLPLPSVDSQTGLLARRARSMFSEQVLPLKSQLPWGLIHNDGNDHNLLLNPDGSELAALIDFGDMDEAPRLVELAVTATYAMMQQADPIARLQALLAGWQSHLPLSELEWHALWPMILGRLSLSLHHSLAASAADPDQDYVQVSSLPAQRLLSWALEQDGPGLVAELRRRSLAPTVPGAASAGVNPAWAAPANPNHASVASLLARRQTRLAANLSLAYDQPLHIVRGEGCWLYDSSGRAYLDCVNNVAHVGHCHPFVVAATARQNALLNTNTRYLHEAILDLADSLCALLPAHLDTCFFVNSGSEANDLALRLASTWSGRSGVYCLEAAYHGHLERLIGISPYKCLGPGGIGLAQHAVMLPLPFALPGLAPPSVQDALAIMDLAWRRGFRPAAFIAESIPGCAGQRTLPPDYLPALQAKLVQQGGILIADEVQTGLGRTGEHFWAFQSTGLQPDVVTVGKPLGNGHPVAAVITRREIAQAFANGMEYFNTFGGNPVSCVTARAVLDVLEREKLQANAASTGRYLLERLRGLAAGLPALADVRGLGFFLGLEWQDPQTGQAASEKVREVINAMAREGILLSSDGPQRNVIKIKPPMVFSLPHADLLADTLHRVATRIMDFS
jgi:4-aminobutyrate aminotransferase-like enzyme/Ser/Thr protein kinase RdoA (MazF antagonist)